MRIFPTACLLLLFSAPCAAQDSTRAAMSAPPSPETAGRVVATDTTTASARRFWAAPPAEGAWLGQDKLLHASLLYSTAVTLRASGASTGASLLGAAGVGLAKEAHDWLIRSPGEPSQGVSGRDLAADGVGVLLAALAIHLWFR